MEAVTGGIASDTTLVVTYKAVINDDAVVGANTNEAKLIYNNDPMDGGNSYDDPTDPEPSDPNYKDVTEEINDTNTVYTYRLGFKKVGEGDDANALPGAKFGIYAIDSSLADAAVSNKSVENATLVDIVTTGSDGYAVSGQLSKGTYLIKEISAPATYSLSETVYKVDVNKGTATTTTTATKRVYTATAPVEGAKQVGWLKGGTEGNDGHTGVFYPIGKYQTEEAATNDGAVKAYLKSETTTTSVVTTDEKEGNGTTLLKENGNVVGIPNTKLTSLPSTGGIGTTIFTIGGCAIMIVAAGLFFASRRKSSK